MSEPFTFSSTHPAVASVVFMNDQGEVVFKVLPRGVLEAGPGLSPEQATQELFTAMAKHFPLLFQAWADR